MVWGKDRGPDNREGYDPADPNHQIKKSAGATMKLPVDRGTPADEVDKLSEKVENAPTESSKVYLGDEVYDTVAEAAGDIGVSEEALRHVLDVGWMEALDPDTPRDPRIEAEIEKLGEETKEGYKGDADEYENPFGDAWLPESESIRLYDDQGQPE